MKSSIGSVVFALLSFVSISARADEPSQEIASTSSAATTVTLASDWDKTVLYRHAGTSYGTGYVAGRAASVTTVHLEKICKLPCTARLSPNGSYIVDAPGMAARVFEVGASTQPQQLQVKGASSALLAASLWGTILGGSVAIAGGTTWALIGNGEDAFGNKRDASPYQILTFTGAAVAAVGIVGLILLPRTHVESIEGERLDARADQPTTTARARFTGNGFVF